MVFINDYPGILSGVARPDNLMSRPPINPAVGSRNVSDASVLARLQSSSTQLDGNSQDSSNSVLRDALPAYDQRGGLAPVVQQTSQSFPLTTSVLIQGFWFVPAPIEYYSMGISGLIITLGQGVMREYVLRSEGTAQLLTSAQYAKISGGYLFDLRSGLGGVLGFVLSDTQLGALQYVSDPMNLRIQNGSPDPSPKAMNAFGDWWGSVNCCITCYAMHRLPGLTSGWAEAFDCACCGGNCCGSGKRDIKPGGGRSGGAGSSGGW